MNSRRWGLLEQSGPQEVFCDCRSVSRLRERFAFARSAFDQRALVEGKAGAFRVDKELVALTGACLDRRSPALSGSLATRQEEGGAFTGNAPRCARG